MRPSEFGPIFRRLFAAAFLQEVSFALLVHLPGYLSELGATESWIGVLYSAGAVVSLLCRPGLGRLLDLARRRSVILAGGAIHVAVLMALTTTSHWGPYLWLLCVLQRTFQIVLFAAMLTYGADSIPAARRTQGLALFGLSGLIPLALGGYAGDVILRWGSFRTLFWTAVAASLASLLIVWSFPLLPIRGREPRRGFWPALAQANLLPIWFVTLLFCVGLEALFTFTRTYVQVRSIGSAGMFFGAYGIAAVITRVLVSRLFHHFAHRPLLVCSIGLYGSGLVWMAVAASSSSLVAAAICCGTGHGVAFPLLSSEVVNRARISERGSAMAMFTAIFDIALLLGAPAVGFMIDGASYTVAFAATGIALFTGAVVYWFWDQRLASLPPAAEDAIES